MSRRDMDDQDDREVSLSAIWFSFEVWNYGFPLLCRFDGAEGRSKKLNQVVQYQILIIQSIRDKNLFMHRSSIQSWGF